MEPEHGRSFRVVQSSGNSLEDLSQALEMGNFGMVHGMWEATDAKEIHHRFGGWPHSMVAVGVDYPDGKVRLLNPADPHPGSIEPDDRTTFPAARLSAMPMDEFLAFWGRKSLVNLYTRPFTMTVVIAEL